MTEKVVVVGNCQAAPFATCLRLLNPALDVQVARLVRGKDAEAQRRAFANLRGADVIFWQPDVESAFRRMGVEPPSTTSTNLVLYPKVTFSAFHPDFFLLRDQNGKFVQSACSSYHSIIAISAFANGLPEERTLRLFNSFMYARLGYLDKFVPWKNLLLSRAREIGYELQDAFDAWLVEGAFMHTLHHPTIRVLASVAVRAMAKANLKQTRSPAELPDPLARAARLPVYPEIARSLGVDPIPNFRIPPRNQVAAHDLSLERFVRQTYAMYRALKPEVLETGEIKAARVILATEVLN
jgi:hypothetical protein